MLKDQDTAFLIVLSGPMQYHIKAFDFISLVGMVCAWKTQKQVFGNMAVSIVGRYIETVFF